MSDLLRTYAVEEAVTREDEADRRAACTACSTITCTRQRGICLPLPLPLRWRGRPHPGVMLEKIAGPVRAAEWFENEQHVLLAMIAQAAEDGHAPYAWELPWARRVVFPGQNVLAKCWRRPGIRSWRSRPG